MNLPLELHLGLVRLGAELSSVQRVVHEILNTSGLALDDTASDELVAKAQYLVLEAAIRPQEEPAGQGQPAALKQDDRSLLLRIAYPSGQRVSRADLQRALDAASLFPDVSSPASAMQAAACR